ncbi:hypothetical protein H8B15_07610 [Hymenobacter sp. BT507]|uniref:Glycerophosphoryl diester phosphodiesterase membrane domain-containing protein n=1 Tax=Hymenobacter citatus TaxID=2763506 RepID=A0ABR7MI87_9BACT|nr:hypothetical protein [Hymenobacter citatus]MBC6610785.1 hypothetical protein [Hymenobacter citatus]
MRVPFTYPTDFLRERDFGQKIEAAIDFFKAHFRPLGKALLYIVLPLTLVQGIAQGLMMSRMMGMFSGIMQRGRMGRLDPTATASTNNEMLGLIGSPEYLLAVLAGLLVFALLVLTVYGYVVLRMEKADPNEEVTVPEVWQLVRRRFLGTIGAFFGLALCVFGTLLGVGMLVGVVMTVLISGLGTGAGAVVGVISVLGLYAAMFYVMTTLSLFFIIWVRERLGFFATIKRCFSLIWGKWWSTFGLVVVMGLIVGVLAILVYLLSSLISSPFSLISSPEVEPNRLLAAVAGTINSTALLLLYPLLLLAIAFQYFNLVERKEGQSLHALVDQIGGPAPAGYGRLAPTLPEDEGEY